MMMEVSSPPEYARTTRLTLRARFLEGAIVLQFLDPFRSDEIAHTLAQGQSLGRFVSSRHQLQNLFAKSRRLTRARCGHENSVVARHGACDLRPLLGVERHRH